MDALTPVVVAARRTAIGTAGRALSDVPVDALAAPVLAAVAGDLDAAGAAAPVSASASRTIPDPLGIEPANELARGELARWIRVDDVVLGNCMGPGGNIARVSALRAGLGVDVPGGTVDRQCGSGLAAILQAAQSVQSGAAQVVVAGGAESASTAPLRAHRGSEPDAAPTPYNRAAFTPPEFGDPGMGEAADALASVCGVNRERQDAYAVASHAKARAARSNGRFTAETVVVAGLTQDERPRTLRTATLARMPAAFVPGGTVTAGNSCPISDGAAAVGIVTEAARVRAGIPGLRLVAGAVVGCDPRWPGWGPVPAVERVLAAAGVSITDVAAVEIVEAFAGQVLAVTDALGLDPLDRHGDVVCADGGALALGHPWGATGAVVVVRLFSRLVRGGAPTGTLGLATAAVGGGLGVAALFEVVGC
ncbi:thiolase family protein [Phytoactinopolyspora limicola]|uniref:thiolase family protein n=1 Tax=Phytoactinopolyspora limicola TaxID=2715536 RepID=UPI001407DA9B|nr:thiolase family protein [Phytoactinopolyspora limicola]